MFHALRQYGTIIVHCTLMAVGYGLVHNQVTIRVCPEYFTVAHPRVLNAESLTLIALWWGVIATWWVGAGLGVPLAIAAQAGGPPRLRANHLTRPLAFVLAACAIAAIITGATGFALAKYGVLQVPMQWVEQIPSERHARFFAAAGSHLASYWVGAAAGLTLIGWTWGWRMGARSKVCDGFSDAHSRP